MAGADVAVIGAGWAGLAAAIRLARAGRHVHLIESAPVPGGRAREAQLDFGFGPITLDAGQHLLVGAYHETLALAQWLHASRAPLERFPLSLRDTAGLRLDSLPLPAPLHLAGALLRAHGLSLRERLALLRFMVDLRRASWRGATGECVDALLARFGQPASLIERLWAPLCVAALNTAPSEACASVYARVLRDTLGGARGASDFLLPRSTLGALIAHPAATWLREHGARLSWRTTVRSISACPGGWRLHTQGPGAEAGQPAPAGARPPFEGASLDVRQVVLAVPARNAARLLAPLSGRAALLAQFVADPIATVYLAWPAAQVRQLPRWIMLRESPERGEHGQWLFDRGCARGHRLAAAVISTSGRRGVDAGALAGGVARQLAAQMNLPAPLATRTVVEKRATIRCTPLRPRVHADLVAAEAPGLWLAGDFAYPDYPATLESAVRSGQIAAAHALAVDSN